jgi:ABC-2 type transport system ATP-binding protein
MQQKVQFIAAVIHEPELLILDEVFSGLDPNNRVLMRELIDEQHKRGCTILFSTHSMYEAEQLCDRILMIHEGRKALDMPLNEIWRKFDPRSVIAEPQVDVDITRYGQMPGVAFARAVEGKSKQIEFGLAEGAPPAAVMAALVAGGEFRSIAIKRPSLEDIFIDIVEADEETLAALRQNRELAAATGGAQ